MNWTKAKNILIVFLLLTFLLLSAMLYDSEKNSSQIQPETVDYAINLLHERGIEIDPQIIPGTIDTMHILEVENVITDYSSFAKLAIPDCTQTSDVVYSSEKGTIEFYGDSFTLSYTNGHKTDKKLKSPAEKAKAYLAGLEIDVSTASVSTSNNAEGLFTVTFVKIVEGLSFFDCKLTVTFDGENIINVSGTWFKEAPLPTTSVTIDFPHGLLIKYSSSNEDFSDIVVTDLTLGYAINENGVYHKQATLIPVYRVTTTDNRVFYIDARRA